VDNACREYIDHNRCSEGIDMWCWLLTPTTDHTRCYVHESYMITSNWPCTVGPAMGPRSPAAALLLINPCCHPRHRCHIVLASQTLCPRIRLSTGGVCTRCLPSSILPRPALLCTCPVCRCQCLQHLLHDQADGDQLALRALGQAQLPVQQQGLKVVGELLQGMRDGGGRWCSCCRDVLDSRCSSL
jgi:hypothetical protein